MPFAASLIEITSSYESLPTPGCAAMRVSVVERPPRSIVTAREPAGVMPFTDDGAPYVGESSAVPGYHVCLATTGFTLMPLLARMLAEHMATRAPLPPSFSPDRGSSHPKPTT